MLVDNSLSGPIGIQPSNTQLNRTAREGAVTVSDPARAAYSTTQLVHGLTTLEVSTGYHRNATPRLAAPLPTTGPWTVRLYVRVPPLQDAGYGENETRWLLRIGTTGIVARQSADGVLQVRAQPDDLTQPLVAHTFAGPGIQLDQLIRLELSYDGADTVCEGYAGHSTTLLGTWTWAGSDFGRSLEVSAYRYRTGFYLPYGNTTFSQVVADYQQWMMDLGYPAPQFGADGFYGDEMASQWDGFAGDHGLGELVGTFGSGGGAGPEVAAAVDLAIDELNATATPPPVSLSHLAVDDVAIGPASTPGTGASLAASASVGSTGSKHTLVSATVAGQAVLSSTASKHVATTAHLSATGSITAEVSAQHIPTFPPLLTTELLIDGAWVDITSDVRTSDDVMIRRGRADEAARADPSSLSLVLNNRHGHYSPRNPMGRHYGSIGRNTPVRVRAGALPDPGVTLLADAFEREVTDGWGSADTGSAWVQASGLPEHVAVTGGVGTMRLPEINYFVSMANAETVAADFDAVWEVSADTLPQGELPGALYMAMDARTTETGGYHAVRMNARVATYSGSPDGRARVGADIGLYTAGAYRQITPISAVAQGVTYAPGEWLSVRCVGKGTWVGMKVWPAGEPEPSVWIAQGHVPEDSVFDGPIVLRAHVTASANETPLPMTVSWDGLRIARPTAPAPAVRFAGEISSWPPRWEPSDSDVWVPIAASGIMRRLGQGQKPLQSVLRRSVPTFRPLAYWPMEDGSLATQAAEATGHGTPLATEGLAYGEVDTLISSAPLPKVRPNARMMSGPIPAQDSGSWEVDMLFRMDESTTSTENQMVLDFVTTTMRVYVVTTVYTDGRPIMVLHATDMDGNFLTGAVYIYIDRASPPLILGQWSRMQVRSWNDQGETRVELRVYDQDTFWVRTSLLPGVPPGALVRIDTRFGTELKDLSIGHITAWGGHESAAYFRPFGGYAGESTTDRLSRLSVGDQVPVLVDGDAATELGPEPPGTWLEAVGSAQDADLGTPGESREELGLTYRARQALYNREPALVLDYASGHISDPVEPIDDDQQVRNDVETKREYGSSYRVVDETGPLGVNAVGRYDETTTLSLASDDQLADQAGWRLHLGTVDELRWPTIRVNLANLRMRAMIPTILGLDAGDRVRILNPPHWTQAADLDLIVQGYEERLNAFVWELTLTCTPASAWTVGHVADSAETAPDPTAPERADSETSTLEFGVAADETSLAVSTTGQTWTVDSADFPLDIIAGGEVMRVTSIIGDGLNGFPQSLIVERSINDIVKDHAAGTEVRLAQPTTVAL